MNRVAIVLSGVVFALAASGGAFAQTPNRTAVQNQIVSNEKAIMDAIGKNDPKAFHTYVAADSFTVGPSGLAKASDFDQFMKACKYTRWGLTGSQFYWVNETTVVHTFHWMGQGTCGGQAVPESTWASTVWSNKGGKWIAAFHQESMADAPPPAKR